MTDNYGTFKYAYRYRESLIGGVTAGFFLILVGFLFIMTRGLFTGVINFFNDFELLRQIPNTPILWPAPAQPLNHTIVYRAVEQFSYAFGVFQVVILALRFAARSKMEKKAETAGNLVFWLGLGYLTRILLLQPTRWASLTTWFIFWAAVFMLIGVTLIIRAIILAATMTRRTT